MVKKSDKSDTQSPFNDDDMPDPRQAAAEIAKTPVAANNDTSAARGGRPSQSEVAARPPAGTLSAIKLEHPHRVGIMCPGCGRTVDPRIVRTYGNDRQVECTSCLRQYMVGYNSQGWPTTYRFIR